MVYTVQVIYNRDRSASSDLDDLDHQTGIFSDVRKCRTCQVLSNLNLPNTGSVCGCRSMAMQHRPEYQLSSQSPVLTARFHPFDTHVIIGGTYSGQASGNGIITS